MKTLLLNIIFALMLLSYYLDYELRTERKCSKNDIKQLKQDNLIIVDSLKKEIYVKDSIVMDCEGVLMNKKDAIRFKLIYNKAK